MIDVTAMTISGGPLKFMTGRNCAETSGYLRPSDPLIPPRVQNGGHQSQDIQVPAGMAVAREVKITYMVMGCPSELIYGELKLR